MGITHRSCRIRRTLAGLAVAVLPAGAGAGLLTAPPAHAHELAVPTSVGTIFIDTDQLLHRRSFDRFDDGDVFGEQAGDEVVFENSPITVNQGGFGSDASSFVAQ